MQQIKIGKIENLTFEPKLNDKLHKILVETFLQYGIEVNTTAHFTINGSISTFDLKTLSEKNLLTTEYNILLVCDFEIIDENTKQTQKFSSISFPFTISFPTRGKLDLVIAQKNIATEKALKELTKELIRNIIYKK
ncbi:MAG: LPS assembly lipoprotein LptE [Thermodesulfovibrionales bacterium]|nr:LPS assembly lipoprotein LptE [Thermodesulfovibrionales bacterium]